MKLQNRTAIITGGSRGIGKAIALEMAKNGAKICVIYNSNFDKANETLKEIKQISENSIIIKANIKNETAVEQAVKTAYENFGQIDILVNNAGIVRDFSFAGMSSAEWNDVIDTNLTGTFNMCKATAKYMILQKKGKIINISSVVAQKGNRGQLNYVASKGGIESMTRGLAIELAPKNILVNAIAPGVIETDMTKSIIEKNKEKILSKILLGRFGRSDEVAKLAAFLSSDDANYITGEIININGGWGLAI